MEWTNTWIGITLWRYPKANEETKFYSHLFLFIRVFSNSVGTDRQTYIRTCWAVSSQLKIQNTACLLCYWLENCKSLQHRPLSSCNSALHSALSPPYLSLCLSLSEESPSPFSVAPLRVSAIQLFLIPDCISSCWKFNVVPGNTKMLRYT